MPRKAANAKKVYKKKAAPKAASKSNSSNKFVKNYNKPYQYPGLGRAIGGGIGSLAGGAVAGPAGSGVGGLIGQAVGHGAHSLIKSVTGYGDYNVSKNSLIYNIDAVPQFTNNARCTMVCHREFISDVRGSTNFNIATYQINPANPITFPWLSGIAQNYEEYVVQGMIFEFKTTSAMAVSSTNTALGTVILATQYNSLDNQFTNKQQMENYEFAQSTVACNSVLHPIECDPHLTANQGLFYVNNPNTVIGDPRLYNIGKFSIATVGMQAIAVIGELWITYKICLLKPRLSGNVSFADHWVLDASNITLTNAFGITPELSGNSTSYFYQNTVNAMTSLITCPWAPALTGPNTIYINPGFSGQIMIVYQLHGGPASMTDFIIILNGNCVYISQPGINSGFVTYPKPYAASGIGIGELQFSAVIQCNGGYSGSNPPSITFTSGALSASPTFGNLAIYAIPSNLSN